jgi:hypothetical protein
VAAYRDRNGDREQNPGEPPLPGVAFVLSRDDRPVGNILTGKKGESTCFAALPPGRYRLDTIAPPGCRPTSGDTWQIQLGAGDARIRAGFRSLSHPAIAWPTGTENGAPATPETAPPGLIALWVLFLAAGSILLALGLAALTKPRHR